MKKCAVPVAVKADFSWLQFGLAAHNLASTVKSLAFAADVRTLAVTANANRVDLMNVLLT